MTRGAHRGGGSNFSANNHGGYTPQQNSQRPPQYAVQKSPRRWATFQFILNAKMISDTKTPRPLSIKMHQCITPRHNTPIRPHPCQCIEDLHQGRKLAHLGTDLEKCKGWEQFRAHPYFLTSCQCQTILRVNSWHRCQKRVTNLHVKSLDIDTMSKNMNTLYELVILNVH